MKNTLKNIAKVLNFGDVNYIQKAVFTSTH